MGNHPMLAVLVSAAVVASAHAQPTIREIPGPPGRSLDSINLSRNGEWIGAVSGGTPYQLHRYRVADLSRADLGQGPQQVNFADLARQGVSTDGLSMAVRWGNLAWRWHDGAWSFLVGPQGCAGPSFPSHLSADGSVAIGRTSTNTCHMQVWRSEGGAAAQVLVSGGPTHVNFPACSADGAVIAWSDDQGPRSYVNGQPYENGVSVGAVSPDGQTLAGFNGYTFVTWQWQSAQPVQHWQNVSTSTVSHVLDGGALALGWEANIGAGPSNWIWTPWGGKVSLPQYLQALGVNLTGWNHILASDMSDDAHVFVGGGQVNGQWRYWVVDTSGVCYADCNMSGTLTVADFTCFQTRFVAGEPYADCNQSGGTLTVADFTCFQSAFVAGCP